MRTTKRRSDESAKRVNGHCALLALGAAVIAAGGGCPSQMMAAQGVPQRGPTKFELQRYENGEVKSFKGETAGGTSSELHYEKHIKQEADGSRTEDTIATSDPTRVQQLHYDAVANQSRIDADHIDRAFTRVMDRLEALPEKMISAASAAKNAGLIASGGTADASASGNWKAQVLAFLVDPAKRSEALADPLIRELLSRMTPTPVAAQTATPAGTRMDSESITTMAISLLRDPEFRKAAGLPPLTP